MSGCGVAHAEPPEAVPGTVASGGKGAFVLGPLSRSDRLGRACRGTPPATWKAMPMTEHGNLKRRVRARVAKPGETCTAALRHIRGASRTENASGARTVRLAVARQLHLWAVFGSVHRLTPPIPPHNSLHVVSGQPRDRQRRAPAVAHLDFVHVHAGQRAGDLRQGSCPLRLCPRHGGTVFWRSSSSTSDWTSIASSSRPPAPRLPMARPLPPRPWAMPRAMPIG